MNEWQPIETASTTAPVPGGHLVRGAYFLAYCPDESATDPQGCICVCWWEPHMYGLDKGGWQVAGAKERALIRNRLRPEPPESIR